MSILETSVGTIITAVIGGFITLIIKRYGSKILSFLTSSSSEDMLQDYKKSISDYFDSIQQRDRTIRYLDKGRLKYERKYERAHKIIDELERLNQHDHAQVERIFQRHPELRDQYQPDDDLEQIEKEIEELDNDD